MKKKIGYILMLVVIPALIVPALAQDTVTVSPETATINITQDTMADQNNIPEPTDTVLAPTETAMPTITEMTTEIAVTETPVQTTEKKPSPGFEAIIAIAAIALIAMKIGRR